MSKSKSNLYWVGLLAGLLAGCGSPDENAQTYYQRGMDLVAKHDDVNARMEFLKAAKYKGDRADIWRALAGVDERTKAGASAVFGDLRRVVELDADDLDSRLKLAQIMIAGNAADAALKILDAAKETKPNATLHALRAVALLRTKDSAGGVREAQRALEIDPSNVEGTIILASSKTVAGDAEGALKLLNGLPVDQQGSPRVLLAKVPALVKKGDTSQAEALLQKLVADNPKEAALRGQLIQLYVSNKRFDDAERELRALADATPTDTKAGLNLVRFIASVKGSKAATDELNARIKAGGDIFDYQIAAAEFAFAGGQVQQAADQLNDLAKTASTPERKLVAQATLAQMYVAKNDTAAAEPLIGEILQKDRRNTAGLRLRATMRIEKGQIDEAVADLREALNDQPKSPDLLLLMAAAYERGGKNELADRQYADALKISGQNANVALRYAEFLQRRGDLGRAEDALAQSSAQDPRNVQLLTALAQVRLVRQNWAGALAVADTVSKTSENRVLADQIKASALAGQNHIDESLAALEDAHATAPDAVQPVAALVAVYLKTGKADKADALLQQMLKKFPDNAELLVWMGQTKLAQNKTDDASQDFKAAISKQPKYPVSYTLLSDVYARQKNYDEAATVIQAGLKEQPDNINLRLTSAGLQILRGDQAGAISQYEALLKDQPNSALAINNLASLILDSRTDKASVDRGIALADKLKNATLPQFQDTYGWAQFKKGDVKAAIKALEAAQTQMQDSAAFHYHLGMSYAADGQPDKAAEQYKKAMALEPDGTPLKANIIAAMK